MPPVDDGWAALLPIHHGLAKSLGISDVTICPMNEPVYLDFAATTPVDPRVVAAMQPYFSAEFGNPSSVHRWGQQAERALERARRDVAAALNCRPSEIIFTSGGSEADNLALRGAALAARETTGAAHLITNPTEHSAVLSTLRQLPHHFGVRF